MHRLDEQQHDVTLKPLNTVCMSLFFINAATDKKRRNVKGKTTFGDFCVHKLAESVFIPIIKGKPCIHVDCDRLALYFLM